MQHLTINPVYPAIIDPKEMVKVYFCSGALFLTYVKNNKHFSGNELPNKSTKTTKKRRSQNINAKEDLRSLESLQRTFSRLKRIINSNYFGDKSEVFLTLTYKEKYADGDELNRDIKNLWSYVERRNKQNIPLRCLFIIEYQKCGKTHLHVLLKRLDDETLKPTLVRKLFEWNYGSIRIKPLDDEFKLSKYLNALKVPKKRNTLKFYEIGSQIYRRRGKFIELEESIMTYEEAMELVAKHQLKEVESNSYEILYDLNVVNEITEQTFKKIRK